MAMKREKCGTRWKVNGVQGVQRDCIQKVQNTKERVQTSAGCEGNVSAIGRRKK
jgi:hypothetical protein